MRVRGPMEAPTVQHEQHGAVLCALFPPPPSQQDGDGSKNDKTRLAG
jgi:hypothetical protein